MSKIGQPKRCCCCIRVNTGTKFLAVLQIIFGIAQIGFAAGRTSASAILQIVLGCFSLLSGWFGILAISKNNPEFAKRYMYCYWATFLLNSIGGIVCIILLAGAMTRTVSGCDFKGDKHGITTCNIMDLFLKLAFALLIGFYVLYAIVNLHFSFVIRSYYLRLCRMANRKRASTKSTTTTTTNAAIKRANTEVFVEPV